MDGYSIDKNEFGERIKSAREELKMTQQRFAELLGTNQTTIVKYEKGEQIPRADVLAAISKATGKSADWLLFGNESVSNKSKITSEEWLKYFMDLVTNSQVVDGYVPSLYTDYCRGQQEAITLNNFVGCKDSLDMWEYLDKDVATVTFRGRKMAMFFQKFAAIETVKGMLPPDQMKLLEENAISSGKEIFSPNCDFFLVDDEVTF